MRAWTCSLLVLGPFTRLPSFGGTCPLPLRHPPPLVSDVHTPPAPRPLSVCVPDVCPAAPPPSPVSLCRIPRPVDVCERAGCGGLGEGDCTGPLRYGLAVGFGGERDGACVALHRFVVCGF